MLPEIQIENRMKINSIFSTLFFCSRVGGIFISAFGILNKAQPSEWSKRNMISPNGWIYWNAIELSHSPSSFFPSLTNLPGHSLLKGWNNFSHFSCRYPFILFLFSRSSLFFFCWFSFSLFNLNNLDISVVVSLLSDFSLSEIINSHESV